jgi:hypothetical protein
VGAQVSFSLWVLSAWSSPIYFSCLIFF